jgi:HSP20 family protein
MSTTVYDPFRGLDRMFRQVNRTVSADFKAMPMDLYRDGDKFVVKMDLPGVDPATIDIDIDDRTLTVRAERNSAEVENKDKSGWVTRERSYGTFARQISLGSGLDLGKIEANYADGVLSLDIPVAEEAKPRKVTVQHAGSANQIESNTDEQQN